MKLSRRHEILIGCGGHLSIIDFVEGCPVSVPARNCYRVTDSLSRRSETSGVTRLLYINLPILLYNL